MSGACDGDQAGEATCFFCGQAEQVGIADIWTDGAFQIECCCEAMHGLVVQEMADDSAWGRTLLQRAGAEELTGHRLRRVADDGCTMLLDHQLELQPIAFQAARAFVGRYHQHCGSPAAWRFGTAIHNGYLRLGVVMVGNPVAPALNGRGILEVNRLCIRRDVARALAWNAASMLYGWAAREAERRGWTRIITYTRTDEEGTSLRAAGWEPETIVRGRGWHSVRRSRSNTNAWIDKIRWGKKLKPRRSPCGEMQHARPSCPDNNLLDVMLLGGVCTRDPSGLRCDVQRDWQP